MRPACPLLFLVCTLLLPPAAGAGEGPPSSDPRCWPSPEVAERLASARDAWLECGMAAACIDRAAAILQAGLDEHPGDLFLERQLRTLWEIPGLSDRQEAARAAARERYAALAESQPDDPRILYLAGGLEEDPQRRRELFARAIDSDPAFPWAHLGLLAAVRDAGGEPGSELERRHLGAFLDRCPDRIVAAAPYARALEDEPFWRRRVAAGHQALRERFAAGEGSARYDELGSSWRVLYESVPLAEVPDLHATVREDLARVEALGLEDEEGWWQTLESGYELVGDDAAHDRVAAERRERFPCTRSAMLHRETAWKEEHPRPEPSAGERALERWATALWEQAVAWRAECPESFEPRLVQMEAAGAGAELTVEQVETLVDELAAAAAAGEVRLGNAMETLLAGLLVEQGVLLDRVDALASAGAAKERERLLEVIESPSAPERVRVRLREHLASVRWQALRLRAQAAVGRGDVEAAREVLAAMAAALDDLRPAEDAPESDRQRFLAHRGVRLEVAADLAAHEGRHADAAVLYARASGLRSGDPEETLGEGRRAWAAAGGSAEGWQTLTEALAGSASAPTLDRTALRWRERETALPAEIELTDLSGATWGRADFAGKSVFVNLWATWCAPCRKELPEVETLYQRTRDRDDVQVVTFNLDSNPSAAQRYAEKEGFTFPVLLASDLVEEMGGVASIPRSWIVDRSVTVVREQVGFGDPEGWVDEVVGLLERYATGD